MIGADYCRLGRCDDENRASASERRRQAGHRASLAWLKLGSHQRGGARDWSDVVGLQDELLGTFELISLERRRSDGAITLPFGDDPIGMFVFDRAGRFSVQVSEHVPSSDHGGYLAMFGSYVVNERQRTFTLTPRGALDPNMIGTDVLRHATFDGELAVFSTTPERIDGLDVTVYITWRRVQAG